MRQQKIARTQSVKDSKAQKAKTIKARKAPVRVPKIISKPISASKIPKNKRVKT